MGKKASLLLITVAGVIVLVLIEFLSSKTRDFLHISENTVIRVEIGTVVLVILVVANLVFHFCAILTEDVATQIKTLGIALAVDKSSLEGVTAQLEQVAEQLKSVGVALAVDRSSLPGKVVLLSSFEVYEVLSAHAEAANLRIYNSYFGRRPPSQSLNKAKRRYFDRISRLQMQNKEVEYRRSSSDRRESALD
jgi:hypothetical protein